MQEAAAQRELNQSQGGSDDIDLVRVFAFLWIHRLLFCLCTSVGLISGLVLPKLLNREDFVARVPLALTKPLPGELVIMFNKIVANPKVAGSIKDRLKTTGSLALQSYSQEQFLATSAGSLGEAARPLLLETQGVPPYSSLRIVSREALSSSAIQEIMAAMNAVDFTAVQRELQLGPQPPAINPTEELAKLQINLARLLTAEENMRAAAVKSEAKLLTLIGRARSQGSKLDNVPFVLIQATEAQGSRLSNMPFSSLLAYASESGIITPQERDVLLADQVKGQITFNINRNLYLAETEATQRRIDELVEIMAVVKPASVWPQWQIDEPLFTSLMAADKIYLRPGKNNLNYALAGALAGFLAALAWQCSRIFWRHNGARFATLVVQPNK